MNKDVVVCGDLAESWATVVDLVVPEVRVVGEEAYDLVSPAAVPECWWVSVAFDLLVVLAFMVVDGANYIKYYI